MSFDGMTVALQTSVLRDVMITVPVKETKVQRFVRLFTRKDAPTTQRSVIREVDAFRELNFDDSHDAEVVRPLLERMTENGWEIVSVVVDADNLSYELVSGYNSSPSGDHVGTLLVALTDTNEHRQTGLIAAVKEYGFDTDLTSEWMDDHYNGEWKSPAEYAENLVEDCYSVDIPDFVSIDWDDTADTLSQDYDYVTDEESGSTHVFHRY